METCFDVFHPMELAKPFLIWKRKNVSITTDKALMLDTDIFQRIVRAKEWKD